MALAMFAAAIGDRQWPEPGLVPEGKEHQIEREQVEQQVGRGEPVAFEERPAGQRGPGGHHEPLAGLGCLLWVNAGPDVPCPAGGPARRPFGDAGVGAYQERDRQHQDDQGERDARDPEIGRGDVPPRRRHQPGAEQGDQGDRGYQAGQADRLTGRGRGDTLRLQRAHVQQGAGRRPERGDVTDQEG